jgi:hypothetical protein
MQEAKRILFAAINFAAINPTRRSAWIPPPEAECGNAGPWKARVQVSHSSHRPWKSLRDSYIPTAAKAMDVS